MRTKLNGYDVEMPDGSVICSQRMPEGQYLLRTLDDLFVLRACKRCMCLKKAEDFYRGKAHCKDCHKRIVVSWQKKNPELVKKYKCKSNRMWRLKEKSNQLSQSLSR